MDRFIITNLKDSFKIAYLCGCFKVAFIILLNIIDGLLRDLLTKSEGLRLIKSKQVRFINFGKKDPKVISPYLLTFIS